MSPEYLSAIASLLSAVGWPVAVVTTVLVLRRELSGLLTRMKLVRFGSNEVGFDATSFETNNAVAAEKLSQSSEAAEVLKKPAPLDQTMAYMIETDPANAVIFSWQRLQRSMLDLAEAHGIHLDLRSGRKMGEQLRDASLISPQLADVIKSLYSTYKSATHSWEFLLESSAIEQYVVLTRETREAIETARGGSLPTGA
ncbi:hypothetical protein BMW22_20205 [Rhizobium leguminosarum]|uniref:Uncharacterized protein n=1 Tax=Rhizobium leguminosarum TaxID=384 RepID=A0A1L3ZDD6_RHILE|nr:hypothetical protein [Rhizobium leguminosarum]API53622.1 hypothetical protein BMW22_20205 [Rhizobium leguminosarum]